MREIALDTETTGLDPYSGHRIVEIGAVEMVNKTRTGRVFHRYLNPERDVPEDAQRIHGLSTDFLKDKPLFTDVAAEFNAFIADAPLVIHNAGFDMKFLNFELERAGHATLPATRAIDTLLMVRRKFPGSPSSLDALCRRYEIDLSARTYHGALLDAELLADVYLELCGGRQVTIAFQAEVVEAVETISHAPLAIPYRRFDVSEEEAAAHGAMLQKMKNALWVKFTQEQQPAISGN